MSINYTSLAENGDIMIDDLRAEVAHLKKLVETFNALAVGHALEKHNLQDGNALIGKWLSAAMDDPSVCQDMKDDIATWFRLRETANDRT